MYYELYVDVLFAVNMLMNFFVLLTVKNILKCSATHIRIFTLSALSSILTVVIIVLPINYTYIKYILVHIFLNSFLVRYGLFLKRKKEFLKGYIYLYVITFLFGGIIQFLSGLIKLSALTILTAGFAAFLFSRAAIYIYSAYISFEEKLCDVSLKLNSKVLNIKGLIDTGNSLCEPISRQPVCVLSFGTMEKFLSKEEVNILDDYLNYRTVQDNKDSGILKDIRYVPFNSVGKTNGLMPVIKADIIQIRVGEETKEVMSPIIGISEGSFSSQEDYQIIINPRLIN